MSRGGSKKPGGGGASGGSSGRAWPALVGKTVPIKDLQLRESNPRGHSLEQIEQISASMRRWGWTMPVLVDEKSVIIAGHGRVRAARLMGYTEAPVVVAKNWSEDEKRAYVIADNQIASNSEWDSKRLKAEIRALTAAEFDLDLVGFSDDELNKLVIDAPAAPAAPGPTEVIMDRCPTCGSLKRKIEQNG